MSNERRYLKGDTIKCTEFPNPEMLGLWYTVRKQDTANGVILCTRLLETPTKFYAHQVKLVKRPLWNWLRLPFCEVVLNYDRSKAK